MSQETKLREALRWALEWIDAVPEDTVLPAMPGFDRDYVNELLATTTSTEPASRGGAQGRITSDNIGASPAVDLGGLVKFELSAANGKRREYYLAADVHSLLATKAEQAPAPSAKQEPIRGAFLNTQGGVTLCQSGRERESFGFASFLYAAPSASASPAAPTGWREFLEEMTQSGKEMNGSYWIPRAVALLAAAPAVPVPADQPKLTEQAVREVIGDMYLRMQRSYAAEPTRRITFMDLEAVYAHVKRLGLGGCLDAAKLVEAAPSLQQGKEGAGS